MKILITGCAGFIGSHLTEYFLNNGHTVVGVDNFDAFYSKDLKLQNIAIASKHNNFVFHELDIRNSIGFATLSKDIEAVVHLAAKAGVRPSIEDPLGYGETNIKGTLNLLEWMRDAKVNKMIFASSSSVYGNNKKIPFSETDSVDQPISPYAFTKKSCELLNYTYHKLYNFDIINLRFFTVYGPRQRPDLAIRKFIENIQAGTPIHLFGDGNTARDYTFISDIVNGIGSALKYTDKHTNLYEIVNLGNNNPIKLIDMVMSIYTILGKEPNIIYESMQPGDVDITYADITKASKLFNYNPSTSFEDGIKKFVGWILTSNNQR